MFGVGRSDRQSELQIRKAGGVEHGDESEDDAQAGRSGSRYLGDRGLAEGGGGSTKLVIRLFTPIRIGASEARLPEALRRNGAIAAAIASPQAARPSADEKGLRFVSPQLAVPPWPLWAPKQR